MGEKTGWSLYVLVTQDQPCNYISLCQYKKILLYFDKLDIIIDPIRNPFSPGAGTPPPELAGRQLILNKAHIMFERLKAGRSEKSFIESVKLKYQDIEVSLDIDPEIGTADSGDIESDLPLLLTAIAEAALEKKRLPKNPSIALMKVFSEFGLID